MDKWGFSFITMFPLFYKKCQSLYFSALFSMLLVYRARSYDYNSHLISGDTHGADDQNNFFFQFTIPSPKSQSMAISDQNKTTIQSSSQLE